MKVLSVSYPTRLCHSASFECAALGRLRADDYGVALFPELMVGGYQARDLWLSRDYLQSCARTLASIAQLQKDWHRSADASAAPLWIIGAPHLLNNACYNAAFVLRRGEIVAVYHKNCLAAGGVFDEHRYFRPGSELCFFEHHGVRCGVMICEDIWSDGVIKAYSAGGAELLLVMNASPFEVDKQHRREQRASILAQQYRLAFVMSNLCGAQDELSFDGVAFACNAGGSPVLRSEFLSAGVSELVVADGQLKACAPDAIASVPLPVAQLHTVLTGAIGDYMHSNGLGEVVIGLSGGVDSAVCLCLAAEAVGAENVYALMVVGLHTSPLSIDLAQELADRTGVNYRTVDITSAVQATVQALRRCFRGRMLDVVRQNLQARLRCCVLAGLANQRNALLLGTTNKSEAATGYGTLYGDLAGGIAPLLDITKQNVYQLAHYINRLEEIIPDGILTRAPTAELSENQTDEDSLMPYACLDSILHYHLSLGLELSELRHLAAANGVQFSVEQIDRFAAWMRRSEYKRRQAPMAFKVSQLTFNCDRRYPIALCNQREPGAGASD